MGGAPQLLRVTIMRRCPSVFWPFPASNSAHALNLALPGRASVGAPRLAARVSAVQQQNADNGMTLKFVKYLYRSALERSFAQLRRKMASILFLNATFCDQLTDADHSNPSRLRVSAISLQCKSRRTNIERGQSAIELYLLNSKP
jgi:hypothetical protein